MQTISNSDNQSYTKSEDIDLELKGVVDKCIDKHPYRKFIDTILISGQFNFIHLVNEFRNYY